METNGHRNGQTGPRHGGQPPVNGKPPANGQSPVINGTLPMSRSPFAPPPETPPLYAPSPFAAAGNPLLPDSPADSYGVADLAASTPAGDGQEDFPVQHQDDFPSQHQDDDFAALRPGDADDFAGREASDGGDLGAQRPVSGPPTVSGSAQVMSEPDSGWGTPAGTAASGPRIADGIPGPLGSFPGAFAPQRPKDVPAPAPATAPVADQPDPWVLPEATSGRWAPFRTDPDPRSTAEARVTAREARNDQMEMAMEATRTARRAAADEEAGRRAVPGEGRATEDQALRPGDLDHSPITFWDDAASEQFRTEWHEVKAQFVDDPAAALTRAHDLLSDAVQQLSESMLTARDQLDPLRGTATPDTESMRMAMRGYREFLDRILAL
ncbi:hypothetical protein [Actinoplanes sp. NPDC051859]|uniref:hypothetical protein n=1 Tax=Actinoplanes sp. NPDC051859 TaxID=3363909 RepID=UPI0037B5AA70